MCLPSSLSLVLGHPKAAWTTLCVAESCNILDSTVLRLLVKAVVACGAWLMALCRPNGRYTGLQ